MVMERKGLSGFPLIALEPEKEALLVLAYTLAETIGQPTKANYSIFCYSGLVMN